MMAPGFLMASPSQRAVLVPLISAWYSIAMRSLMQMSIDLDRRMWFVADELPSLQKLKELETCLVEGRKFGACALLAIQSPAQLEMIYGHHNTRVIIGNCATKVSFSSRIQLLQNRFLKSLENEKWRNTRKEFRMEHIKCEME